MNGAFYIGATGLDAQQRALDVIANNIANINTPTFKRSQVRFSELVSPASAGDDLQPVSIAGLSGVSISGSPKVFAQGDLRETGNPLDIAISGDGLLELLGPGGKSLLWRGGAMKVSADGFLAAGNGLPLKAMISVPLGTTALSISRQGVVTALIDGVESPREIGKIDLVLVKDMAGLSPLGEGLYETADPSNLMTVAPGEDGGGAVVQGSLEMSNVQLSDEMVMLLLMQRAYAANAQVVQAGDQLMAIANGLKR